MVASLKIVRIMRFHSKGMVTEESDCQRHRAYSVCRAGACDASDSCLHEITTLGPAYLRTREQTLKLGRRTLLCILVLKNSYGLWPFFGSLRKHLPAPPAAHRIHGCTACQQLAVQLIRLARLATHHPNLVKSTAMVQHYTV